jgi:valyl-tRNA synthetase
MDKTFDAAAVEERARQLWEEREIYAFRPGVEGDVFSVDTPPPYVSAAHLHVGHAMSYAQAEFIVRYQRMRQKNVFYPMGFDDNGLPTERYVEKVYNINKKKTTRSAFRALCLEETRKGATEYERLWRALGLSVDWRLRYSTIDDHCRRTAQKSFLDLHRKGRAYRSEEPVLWDPHFETSLAQADLETIQRKSKLHEIAFAASDGRPLIIATTRPELIPACVALYANPDDARYAPLFGARAKVPLFGWDVPILPDPEVAMDFGTGLMMVCTFGDGEDVKKWKRDRLDTRIAIGPDGRMLPIAGAYAGKTTEEARALIVKDLEKAGAHVKFTMIDQNVSVSERSSAPVEFRMAQQWFIRILDLKGEMRRRSDSLKWHPRWMKERLDQWIDGLKYDWNITRQRFYGVPFPLWYCEGCGEVILADEASLPIDPLESVPPVSTCSKCGGASFRGEPDVMDTWMTSSLTPLVNANWANTPGRLGDLGLHPMTIRVQAFEIIRTWLFYTLVKSHVHVGSLPWSEVMISGWGLNEQGKKISKRDLEQHTDASGYNRYEPYAVIKKYGADALRYWAAQSQLGHDARFNERDVKNGRKVVVKLWNAARFAWMQLDDFDPSAARVPFESRAPDDRWLQSELNLLIQVATRHFENNDYASAREAIDRFFWATWCDDYLEMVKDRFWSRDRYTDAERASARATIWESLRALLGLYAPILPFVTEEIYQRIYRAHETAPSIHVSRWPEDDASRIVKVPAMEIVLAVLRAVRALRTELRIPQTRELVSLTIDTASSDPSTAAMIRSMERTLRAVSRAQKIQWGEAAYDAGSAGVRLSIVPAEKTEGESLEGAG